MGNLYHKEDFAAIVERLQRLTPDAKRQWGKMDISQMLVHLNVSLEPAMGLKFPKRKFVGRLLSPILKKLYLGKKPMPKNSPTNDSYIVTGEHDFATVKKDAIALLITFHENGRAKCTTHPHPYLGQLSPDEWGILKWKHYDHHLRQFGC